MARPAGAAASPATGKRNGRVPAMLDRYRKQIQPELAKAFKHTNPHAVARLEKVVLNMGCGEAAHDAKILEAAQKELGLIAGQRPVVTRAKQAISNFKIREGDPVGCRVTLRRHQMYEFLEKLVHVVLPRIRDFRGLNPKSFDGQGNYTFGIQEQTIFPEIHPDKITRTLGMDVTLVTRAASKEEAMALLRHLGFPFTKQTQETHGTSGVAGTG